MSTMSNRLQVLLDDERRERLERVSRETGAPVSELVRRAIDRAYPADRRDRQQALADFLALEPMPAVGPGRRSDPGLMRGRVVAER